MSRIEWEGLQEEYKIGKLIENDLPKQIDEFKIFRNDDYYLNGKIRGRFDNYEELSCFFQDSEIGEFIDPLNFEIKEKVPVSTTYKIKNIIGKQNNWKNQYGNYSFEYYFAMSSIKRTILPDHKIEWIMEWFLNGPQDPTIYHEGTTHKLVQIYKKKRSYLNSEFKTEKFACGNFDFIKSEYERKNGDECSFVIHSVPDIYPPRWSKKIGIEYRNEWGIPEVDEREEITEIVSFLFGRKLIKVGCSKFVDDGWIAEDIAYSPNISPKIDLPGLCHSSDTPPIKLGYYHNLISRQASNCTKSLTVQFSELVTKYLDLRDELKLNDVLERYWLSESLPSYARLVLLSASLELLVQSWYQSKNSKIKGDFLSHDEFITCFKDELDGFKDKLEKINWKNEEFSSRFLNKVMSSNQMGFNASIHFFFDEIGLEIGEIEKKAITYRNKPAHGKVINYEESKNLLKFEYAYKTLVNRVLLKILDYNWAYIDYYTNEYPLRGIEEPIGKKVLFRRLDLED